MINIDNSKWPGDMPDPEGFDRQENWEDDLSSIDDFDEEDLDFSELDADSDDDISISADEEE